MKSIKLLLAIFLFVPAGALFARGSYLGGSFGIVTDLNGLGETIMVDGLDSKLSGQPSMQGAVLGKGCSEAPDPTACNTEIPGTSAEVIVPENKLITLKRVSGGIVSADTGDSMTGLNLNLFYEQEWDTTFARVGISNIRKITGGRTRSSVAGIEWLNVAWDYKVTIVPLYYGIKSGVGESSSVYGAIGLNYYNGYFQVGGKNLGDIPTQLLGIPTGATTVIDPYTGATKGGGLLHESARFKANGFGTALLVGFETKTENGNKWFIEVNYIAAGGQGDANTQDLGGAKHMTSAPTYPFVLNGTYVTVGYKYAI